ncbi:MAG TPA: hypothetical protein VF828_05355 [Patescibacteria group bacterium]
MKKIILPLTIVLFSAFLLSACGNQNSAASTVNSQPPQAAAPTLTPVPSEAAAVTPAVESATDTHLTDDQLLQQLSSEKDINIDSQFTGL